MVTMQNSSNMGMQPFQLGLRKFCMIAKFGNIEQMHIGQNNDKALNTLAMSID